MSRIGKQLRVAFESLNIEKAIEDSLNAPPEGSDDDVIDSAIEDIKNQEINVSNDKDTGLPELDSTPVDTETENDASTEETTTPEESPTEEVEAEDDISLDSPEGDMASDKAEEAGDKAKEADDAIASLESIIELLERSEETGGLDPNGGEMLNLATGIITTPVGVAIEAIDSDSLNSYSNRKKFTTDTISRIKEASIKIFEKIIEFIKKMMEFSKEAYRFYNSELFATKNKFDAVRKMHRGQLKTEPATERVKGLVAGAILSGKESESSDVVESAEKTYSALTDFSIAFTKDLTNAISSIEEFKDKAFNIDLEEESNLIERETVKSLSQYGAFFGTEINSNLKKVNEIDGLRKPSNTIACFESEKLAGGVKIIAFLPNTLNLIGSDILLSTIQFQKPDSEKSPTYDDGVAVCDLHDFAKLFRVVDNMFNNNRRIGKAIEMVNKENGKLLDYAKAMSGVLTKVITGSLERGGFETNQTNGPMLVKSLIVAVKNCYIESINQNLKYSARYTRALVSYLEHSTKQYL